MTTLEGKVCAFQNSEMFSCIIPNAMMIQAETHEIKRIGWRTSLLGCLTLRCLLSASQMMFHNVGISWFGCGRCCLVMLYSIFYSPKTLFHQAPKLTDECICSQRCHSLYTQLKRLLPLVRPSGALQGTLTLSTW